ncbi:MAG TPA: S1/P1 nuclease [Gemmatimonadaceae bacterium]
MIRRSRSLIVAGVLTVAVLVLPALASAWNATGHRTVAEIAWENLTPAARTRAVDLLMHGPALAGLATLRPDAGPDSARDRALFLNAATWPDLIRGRGPAWHAYDHPSWHYADFYWDDVNGQPHDIAGTGPDSINAGERIVAFRQALSDPNVADTTKAVDMVWLMHLVGDIHNPLHASSRVTTESPLPRGDEGGNLVMLNDRHRLHAFWDDILDESIAREPGEDSIAYATRLAAEIVTRDPIASMAPRASDRDVSIWEHESLDLAQHAYTGIVPGSAPSAEYKAATLATSESQIALAGYRLAALLNAALK